MTTKIGFYENEVKTSFAKEMFAQLRIKIREASIALKRQYTEAEINDFAKAVFDVEHKDLKPFLKNGQNA